MVRGLNGNDVSAKVRAKEETEGLDDIGSLGLPPREAQLCKLLVWLQHHKVWSKHNPRCLLLVIVDLDSCVVGHTETDYLGLVSFYSSTRASWEGRRREYGGHQGDREGKRGRE